MTATAPRPRFGRRLWLAAGKLLNAFMRVVAWGLAILLIGGVVLMALAVNKPVTVEDGAAPAWLLGRAYLTDVSGWSAECWAKQAAVDIEMVPGAIGMLIQFGDRMDPADAEHMRDEIPMMLLYGMDWNTEAIGRERLKGCYIPRPKWRTVAELETYRWPWEPQP